MAALVKVSGRRVETIIQEIPDPPPIPKPTTPPTIPPPADPPARDPWNYLGGVLTEDGFIPGRSFTTRTIEVYIPQYGQYLYFRGTFVGGKQYGAWINSTIKLYPDYHPQKRTLIPEWDYFNW